MPQFYYSCGLVGRAEEVCKKSGIGGSRADTTGENEWGPWIWPLTLVGKSLLGPKTQLTSNKDHRG
ncbi:hypothetical protein SESBI_19222 [Sesbania bispinosa]|nr:hypothetical protein SESBI_19222 [Sesbania bispinosa]